MHHHLVGTNTRELPSDHRRGLEEWRGTDTKVSPILSSNCFASALLV
jgi:hypothetical protein